MSGAEERCIALTHATLAAKCWGNPAFPPVLALHGWLDNAGSFDYLAPHLAQKRFIVALDLRGHGRSSHLPAGAWYHYIDYFDDILATLDHFGWQRVDFLGHSLGGTLASLFAALYPERVGNLLLIEALGALTAPADAALAQLRRALDERVAFATRRPLRVFADLASALAARCAAGDLSPFAARALIERGVTAIEGGFVWSSDPRLMLASPQRFSEAQMRAMLQAIRARTLLVLAEPATRYLPSAIIANRAAHVADMCIVRLAGGHHLHMDDAESVARAIRTFRDGVTA